MVNRNILENLLFLAIINCSHRFLTCEGQNVFKSVWLESINQFNAFMVFYVILWTIFTLYESLIVISILLMCKQSNNRALESISYDCQYTSRKGSILCWFSCIFIAQKIAAAQCYKYDVLHVLREGV